MPHRAFGPAFTSAGRLAGWLGQDPGAEASVPIYPEGVGYSAYAEPFYIRS